MKYKLTQSGSEIQRDLDVIEHLIDEYDTGNEYNKQDLATHLHKIYICLEDGVTGEFDSSKWMEVNLEQLLWNKNDKVGPLPKYTVSANDTILDFINANQLTFNTPILLSIGEEKLVGTVFYFTSYENGIGVNLKSLTSNYAYYTSFTTDVENKKFGDIIYNTAKTYFEKQENKVTSLSASSTDTEYPSAKCVYDILNNNNIFPYEVYGNTNIFTFVDEHPEIAGKIILLKYKQEVFNNGIMYIGKVSYSTYGGAKYSNFQFCDIGTNKIYYGNHEAILLFSGIFNDNNLIKFEDLSNKVTSLSASSTNKQYPSAKAVWDVKGTKLYKHTIYIEDNDTIVELHIINTSSIPYQSTDFNSDEKLFDIIVASIRIILQTFYVDEPVGQTVTNMFFNDGNNYLNICCYTDVYEEVSISYTSLEQFNDTVTEL